MSSFSLRESPMKIYRSSRPAWPEWPFCLDAGSSRSRANARQTPPSYRRHGLRLRHGAELLLRPVRHQCGRRQGHRRSAGHDLVKDGTYSVIERKATGQDPGRAEFLQLQPRRPHQRRQDRQAAGRGRHHRGQHHRVRQRDQEDRPGRRGRQLARLRSGQCRPLQFESQRGHHRAHRSTWIRPKSWPSPKARASPPEPAPTCWAAAATGTASAAGMPISAPAISRTPSSAKPPRRRWMT